MCHFIDFCEITKKTGSKRLNLSKKYIVSFYWHLLWEVLLACRLCIHLKLMSTNMFFLPKSSLTNVRRCLCLLFPRIHRWDFYFGVNYIYADNLVVTTMALNFATFSLHNFIHDIVLWCKLYANIALKTYLFPFYGNTPGFFYLWVNILTTVKLYFGLNWKLNNCVAS